MKLLNILIVLILSTFILATPTLAMDEAQAKEFDHILHMKMKDLTAAAQTLLQTRYPDEDWEQYDFPAFVYTSDSVETGYKIAVKVPGLMGSVNASSPEESIPCYCFCDEMGHKNLLYCFWKDGMPGGEFDDHAADCNICYGQAMLAFLWDDIGATRQDILNGMEQKFERLLKLHEEGKM